MKIKAKVLNAFVDKETRKRCEEGQEIELTDKRAKELESLGFAKRIESKIVKKDIKTDD